MWPLDLFAQPTAGPPATLPPNYYIPPRKSSKLSRRPVRKPLPGSAKPPQHCDVLNVPISIPPEYASLKYSCSAYNTYNCHIDEDSFDLPDRQRVLSRTDDSCPRLDRFPWQPRPPTTTQLRPKQRHVEIVIPDWARPIPRPPSLRQLPRLSIPDDRNLSRTKSHPSPPPTPASLASAFSFSKFPNPPGDSSQPSAPPRRRPVRRVVQVEKSQQRTRELREALTADHYIDKPLPPIRLSLPPTPPSSRTPSPHRIDPIMATEPNPPQTGANAAAQSSSSTAAANTLANLVCTVHRTTGSKPPAMVGASTTVSGDTLFVFGGRRLSKRRPHLTSDMYALDLVSRDWTRLETRGTPPAPRYFHTMCALGDTKLVCYGGMVSASHAPDQQDASQGAEGQPEPGILVMSDVHFYDIASREWTLISVHKSPPGRYAHCATILPSHSVFTSEKAPLSALSGSAQNMTIDGKGGAEMIVIGGQDGASNYIQQISVFNLRSLTWTSTTTLGKQCGAYRSLVAPMTTLRASQVGAWSGGREPLEQDDDDEAPEGYTALIYSNYNFHDVRLELEMRLPDGSVVEKPMQGVYVPPGLRFPHGETIANSLIISGTLLSSSRQEFAIWSLDLRTLQWSRIDVGPGVLNTGSWNRGLLWKKRSQFVVLGDRRRKLDEDYNHRRLNFSNMCSVELEAFGLYDNPVTTAPGVGFSSASCPVGNLPELPALDRPAQSQTAQSLGRAVSEFREIADMDFMALGGERVAVNFHIVACRWGPYLTQLLDGASRRPGANGAAAGDDDDDEERRNTVVAHDHVSRNSSITITPGSVTAFSNTISSALDSIGAEPRASSSGTTQSAAHPSLQHPAEMDYASNPALAPTQRARVLFLPHTFITIRALVHYLYTWSLPPAGHPLCSAQTLCSLLQIARPYRVNGLLEATIERLHQSFDGKTTAAIFNAAAMAAGGGDAIARAGQPADAPSRGPRRRPPPAPRAADPAAAAPDATVTDSEDDGGLTSMSSSAASLASLDPRGHADGSSATAAAAAVWAGELSSVVGLQKRGLRGLMEGRAARERMMAEDPGAAGRERNGSAGSVGGGGAGAPAVGLGIGAS